MVLADPRFVKPQPVEPHHQFEVAVEAGQDGSPKRSVSRRASNEEPSPMSRTHTRLMDYRRLQSRGQSGVLVVSLMMACNDLQLANEALTSWAAEQPRTRKYREIGARIYFIRLQFAHLYEALRIVEEIRNDPHLMRIIEQGDSQTRHSFDRLTPFLRDGSRRRWFEDMVGRIRNNVTFHYERSGTLIERAISDIASRDAGRFFSNNSGGHRPPLVFSDRR
jgi:hypothetical protein